MIPFLQVPIYHLGPVPLDPWGTLVCIGFVLGLELARARGIREGLDVRDIVDGIVATVLAGFVVGHLVHVLAYHPEKIESDGWMTLVRVWEGFSSFGGFIGAVLGSVLFYVYIRRKSWWAHADAIVFGIPFAWIFGRLGCFLSHDHVGRLTDFPLAVRYQDAVDFFRSNVPLEARGPRHDLGLYEALLAIGISVVFALAGRRRRTPGFFLMTWCLLYAPVRFLLDFLRAGPGDPGMRSVDVRWAGLTPAQWGCILMFAGGLAILARLRRARAADPAAIGARTDSGTPAG